MDSVRHSEELQECFEATKEKRDTLSKEIETELDQKEKLEKIIAALSQRAGVLEESATKHSQERDECSATINSLKAEALERERNMPIPPTAEELAAIAAAEEAARIEAAEEAARIEAAEEAERDAQIRSHSVNMPDGVILPCDTLQEGRPVDAIGRPCPPLLVFAHGMFDFEELSNNSRRNDFAFCTLKRAFRPGSQRPLAEEDASLLQTLRVVTYDTRGCGESHGWAADNAGQFQLRSLGQDLLQVAVACQEAPGSGFLLGGEGTGATSALWAAILMPTAVRGLILFWGLPMSPEGREARYTALHASSRALRDAGKADAAEVVAAAANGDMPPPEELENLNLPVLILATASGDPLHPGEDAEALALALPNARLVLAESPEDFQQRAPSALASWLRGAFGE